MAYDHNIFMGSPEERFWNWFKSQNLGYLNLDRIDTRTREALLIQFLGVLHQYCDGLFFQICNHETTSELIITAEGDINYFNAVEKLVKQAPKIDNWKIVAFKQAIGTNFITNYEGIKIDPKKSWFLPLENDKERLGLRVYIENFSFNEEEKVLSAIYECLDAMLGEKDSASNVFYVEVDRMPPNPEEGGLIELLELPAYIDWRNGVAKK